MLEKFIEVFHIFFTLFPLVKVSRVFIVKYENQDIDTSIIDSFFRFTSFSCIMDVCVLRSMQFYYVYFFPTTLEVLLHCLLLSIFYDKSQPLMLMLMNSIIVRDYSTLQVFEHYYCFSKFYRKYFYIFYTSLCFNVV